MFNKARVQRRLHPRYFLHEAIVFCLGGSRIHRPLIFTFLRISKTAILRIGFLPIFYRSHQSRITMVAIASTGCKVIEA